jgi:PQQ-like domain
VAAAAIPTPTIRWIAHPTYAVSQSSPISVTTARGPQVIVGDAGGRLYSFARETGAVTWNRSLSTSSVLAPLSTDNTSILVGLTSSTATASTLGGYRAADGATTWGANTCTHCMQLGGAAISGATAALGSAQSRDFGLATNGRPQWSYLNSDSTNSTPAVADLYGDRSHEWVFTTDQTGNANVRPPALAGGHLRIFSASGRELCNANIGGGPAKPGSFDSSPALVSFGTSPVIVFGTGESGTTVNRLMVFNTACQPMWTSPALAGRTVGAPAVADTQGNGLPVVIEEVANSAGHPVVYKIDIRNHKIIGATTLSACSNFRPGSSSSVVTADLGNKGYQDLIVPGGECGAVVLDGKSLAQVGAFGNGCGLQNSPLVTDDGSGRVGITLAGYSAKPGGGLWGCVIHAQVANSSLGTIGWPEFHHDAQLSGSLRQTIAMHDGMIAGQSLGSGRSLTSAAGSNVLSMQADGNLVLRHGATVVWKAIATRAGVAPGSHLVLANTFVRIYSPAGRVMRQLWAVGSNATPVHLVVQTNSKLGLYTAGSNEWSSDVVLWHS